MSSHRQGSRVTLRTIHRWIAGEEKFAMLTCYDATTAGWLWRGGVRCLLAGDTAAQVILGHDSTLPATMPFMLQITAALRRGAPDAFIMADMPFGSYQCGDDQAVAHAVRFLTEGMADVVKLEVDDTHGPLVARLSSAGVPVVAHIGSRPQRVRIQGGYGSVGKTSHEAEQLVQTAKHLVRQGAVMLLIEAVPTPVAQMIVKGITQTAAEARPPRVPVIGCGAGPACDGHVVVLQDLLGMTPWQPPFAKPITNLGEQLSNTAARWVDSIRSGSYFQDQHPYDKTSS